MIQYDGIIFSLQSAGGISTLFEELINGIKEKRLEYRLDLYSKRGSDNDRNKRIKQKRLFERYRKVKPDTKSKIFHSTYYRLPTINRQKVVTTVHDFTYEYFSSGIKKIIHSTQKKNAIFGSDVVICVSENTKNDLIKLYPTFDSTKIVVIHNGVSDDYFPLEQKYLEEGYVLFVGERSGYKNFMDIVPILGESTQLELKCVGGGQFNKKELYILEKYLPKRYEHVGYVTNSQLNILYNDAFFLFYPSKYEGFGIPVIEAMRSGCPVIAMNKSSIPEVSGDAALLVDNLSRETLKEAISCMYLDSYRKKLIHKGFINAKRFSWQKTIDKTIKVYENLL